MSDTTVITINMDKPCAECGNGGAANSGICMACTLKASQGKPMRSAIGRAVAERWKRVAAEARKLPAKGMK